MEEMRVDPITTQTPIAPEAPPRNQKFCKYCGERIDMECVVCPKCGKQVELLKQESVQPQVVIHNANTSTNTNMNTNINRNTNHSGGGYYPYKSKIVALLLCFFLGYFGIHRFYVGKIGTGLIWLFTLGFFGLGWIVDFFVILIGGFRDKAGMPLK